MESGANVWVTAPGLNPGQSALFSGVEKSSGINSGGLGPKRASTLAACEAGMCPEDLVCVVEDNTNLSVTFTFTVL
eukprot:15099394-Ditylum_brightwellii.AAC.1